ncbi:MAG: hypothetical protein ACR2NM_06860 [Bythopirellula sp.]
MQSSRLARRADETSIRFGILRSDDNLHDDNLHFDDCEFKESASSRRGHEKDHVTSALLRRVSLLHLPVETLRRSSVDNVYD